MLLALGLVALLSQAPSPDAPGPGLRGRVVEDESGAPVAGAMVELRGLEIPEPGGEPTKPSASCTVPGMPTSSIVTIAQCTTQQDGSFAFDRAAQRAEWLRVTAPGRGPLLVWPRNASEIPLPRAASIDGVVTGAFQVDKVVALCPSAAWPGQVDVPETLTFEAPVDPQGHYKLRNLPSEVVLELRIDAHGSGVPMHEDLVLAPGECRALAPHLPGQRRVRGHVVGPEQRPVAGARVYLDHWAPGAGWLPIGGRNGDGSPLLWSTTDDQGAFELSLNGPIPQHVAMWDEPSHTLVAEHVAIGPGSADAAVVLYAQQGSFLRGVIVAPSEIAGRLHELREGVTLWASSPARTLRRTAVSDESGRFSIGPFPDHSEVDIDASPHGIPCYLASGPAICPGTDLVLRPAVPTRLRIPDRESRMDVTVLGFSRDFVSPFMPADATAGVYEGFAPLGPSSVVVTTDDDRIGAAQLHTEAEDGSTKDVSLQLRRGVPLDIRTHGSGEWARLVVYCGEMCIHRSTIRMGERRGVLAPEGFECVPSIQLYMPERGTVWYAEPSPRDVRRIECWLK